MEAIKRLGLTAGFGLFVILLAACAPALATPSATAPPNRQDPPTENADATESSTEVPLSDDTEIVREENPFEGVDVRFNTEYWPDTDFGLHSVPYDEFMSGGPPPDGIPAIDNPAFVSVEEAAGWIEDDWPVMFFKQGDDTRAYPLAILIWHEIVNDVVGGEPVALTFCPLCNATIAFSRTLADGTVLDFGTTGNLRKSDLVMYDRQTESWWQQFTGEAIVGEMTGTRLEFLPSQIIAFGDFAEKYPDGRVLSRNTGHNRPYGNNPYGGYDSVNSSPFAFRGETDDRLRPLERVVAIEINGVDVAYPFSELEESRVINDQVGGEPIVVFWKSGTVSTFGSSDEDIGSTGVFSRELDAEVLTFEATADGFVDQETGTTWDLLGEGIAGPLAGQHLEQLVSAEHFWFAWAAFKPDTEVRRAG